MEFLKGEIERVSFRNDENGYTVVRVIACEGRESIVAVGHFADVKPGEIIELFGRWMNHPYHGRQFYVESYRVLLPADSEGIRKYIASGVIKGIGPVIAERIVEKFGPETLDIMDREPDRLLEIEGIGKVRLERIKKAWVEQKEIRDLIQFLQSYGIPTGYASKIFKQYGKASMVILKEDPYRVAMEVSGIGFITADMIAKKIGIPEDSPLRVKGAIIYMLQKLAAEGHLCFPEKRLFGIIEKEFGLARNILEIVANKLLDERLLVRDYGSDSTPFLYLPGLYICEEAASRKLLEISKRVRHLIIPPGLVEKVEETLSFALDRDQRLALTTVLSSKVTIITGGPGTGKTTLVKAIIAAFELLGLRVLLASPTGRAAKRLEEATKRRASTIHRLLRLSPKSRSSNGPSKESSFPPLKGDVIIIDEVSMIDLPLLHHLLKAVSPGMRIVFVGDIDQLPSIGPGMVLRDLIESNLFPVVRLSTIHRQAKDSQIVSNAHRVKEGKMPALISNGRSDFYFIRRDSPEEIANLIVRLFCERIPKSFRLNPLEDIQVLTPMNKGILGTRNLNRLLQDALNPKGFQIERGGERFRVGDRVMQIQNNYEKDVYNGDLGIVRFIDIEYQEVTVDFYGKRVTYDFSELEELTLAYAISIHKSQGGEYQAVIIPVVTQHYVMLRRNLIYTAITRGKQLVVIIGTPKALAMAVKNSSMEERFSLFKERLRRYSLVSVHKE
ncbi:MAG: ATP-dependent RecD-like DNA helicase [Syntrophobacterales bacterium]|nr:ATP-dependent RecD-like DNA helicase [Syntrophobacterales bacterium]